MMELREQEFDRRLQLEKERMATELEVQVEQRVRKSMD